MSRFRTRIITLTGMMIALTIVLTRVFAINIGPAVRLSMGSVCTILTGLWFGPAAGGIAGGLADTIGLMLNPSGAWLPLITCSAVMWGVIPGLLRRFITGSARRKGLILCGIVCLTSLVCQMGLTTFALVSAFGPGTLPGRVLQFAGSTPLYCVVTGLLYLSPVTGQIARIRDDAGISEQEGRIADQAENR